MASSKVDVLYSYVVGGPNGGGRVRRYHLLYEDSTLVARSHEPQDLVDAFERRSRRTLAALVTEPVFVHAGVVAWKGRAILLPGASLAGKSTLVRELVRAGATYYSDEFAPLDAYGLVRPFATALQVRDGRSREVRLTPAAMGCRVGRRPIRVGLVVLTRFRQGARFRPRPLSRSRAAIELLRNVPAAARLGRRLFASVAETVAGAVVVKGDRGNASAAARAIIALAESHRQASTRR